LLAMAEQRLAGRYRLLPGEQGHWGLDGTG
jgi:hypothetical protein